MTGDDTGLLVVPSGVSSQLQDLSRQILEHSGQINQSTGTDALGVVTFAEKSVNTTDGELLLRSSPPRTFVLTSRQVVITTSGAFKSLWSEQDGDLTFLHKIKLFSTTLHL